MSYLIEFQRQQKALRDAERDRKKNASSMLNNYRGGEHDVKEQMKLKALKDADRDNKKKASSDLHKYHGGEHDIKEQMKLKALKDADRDNKKKASSDLHKYQGGEHDVREEMKLKALKDADRDNKKKASSDLHKYQGGEHDIKEQMKLKALKDADRDNKKKASSDLHKYQGGQHDVKDYERAIIRGKSEDRRSYVAQSSPETSEHAPEGDEKPVVSGVSTVLEELTIKEGKEDQACEDNEQQSLPNSPAQTKIQSRGQARENYEQSLSISPTTDTKSSKIQSGKARKPLDIDFSFGIILPDDEPHPDVDFCASAASVIIPHAISQWTNETNIFCNPKAPKVSDDIDTDDWYEADDSVRYKVKGKVPVQVFAESSSKEVEEGLKKVLRRRVSFRPVSESEANNTAAQVVIGDGDQKWMRVRDGMIGGLGITF